MSQAQQGMSATGATQTTSRPWDPRQESLPTGSQRPRQLRIGYSGRLQDKHNVGQRERIVSLAAGAILTLLGLRRRNVTGLLMAGVGSALAWRGATGHCAAYEALGIDTSASDARSRRDRNADRGVHISASYLINKSPQELYSFWKNYENFPRFMSHLESVRKIDDRRSHWVAKAPLLYGHSVEWDAETTTDEPNTRIAWTSLPGGGVQHRGCVKFERALGGRGTNVKVDLHYEPPAGQVGRWLAKLFGEEPEQQIHDDLRNFKRIMETGEVPTIVGQPHGTCLGRKERSSK